MTVEGAECGLETAGIPRQFNKISPKNLGTEQTPITLRPLKAAELAKRLGVSAESIESAAAKGTNSFVEWSKRRDPGSRAWHKKGNFYHPNQD